jgi:hypothetical protein
MMVDKQLIISEFQRIKNLGFVKSNRPNNRDGGIGNTFEDYLGVQENNLREADFEGFEIKSKRQFNSSYLTLFSKSPTNPVGANGILKDKYGECRDPQFPQLKKLYASIFGHRESLVYNKHLMKLDVIHTQQILNLQIKDEFNNYYDEVHWTLDELKGASSKMKNLFVVFAEEKVIDGIRHYHYLNAEIYLNFNFDKFLKSIENGVIMFDIRIGVHKTGNNYGKPHDHGSGFRVKKENISELYDDFISL